VYEIFDVLKQLICFYGGSVQRFGWYVHEGRRYSVTCYLHLFLLLGTMSSGFISEAELAEQRRIRQEEWEKVRKPGQPQGA